MYVGTSVLSVGGRVENFCSPTGVGQRTAVLTGELPFSTAGLPAGGWGGGRELCGAGFLAALLFGVVWTSWSRYVRTYVLTYVRTYLRTYVPK